MVFILAQADPILRAGLLTYLFRSSYPGAAVGDL